MFISHNWNKSKLTQGNQVKTIKIGHRKQIYNTEVKKASLIRWYSSKGIPPGGPCAWGKILAGSRSSKCKGPVAARCPPHLRNSNEWVRAKEVDEVWERMESRHWIRYYFVGRWKDLDFSLHEVGAIGRGPQQGRDIVCLCFNRITLAAVLRPTE